MYKLKFTRLQSEILRLLIIKAGSKLNQRAIARFLSVSPTAIAKATKDLEKADLINIQRDKVINLNTITLNRDNPKTTQLKRADNLRQIYESGLADFLEKELAGATIILFGSYSRGEDIITSDIDIAAIGRKEKQLNLTKFDKLLERTIRINFYTSFNKIHKHLRENLFNGIILAGGVEL